MPALWAAHGRALPRKKRVSPVFQGPAPGWQPSTRRSLRHMASPRDLAAVLTGLSRGWSLQRTSALSEGDLPSPGLREFVRKPEPGPEHLQRRRGRGPRPGRACWPGACGPLCRELGGGGVAGSWGGGVQSTFQFLQLSVQPLNELVLFFCFKPMSP